MIDVLCYRESWPSGGPDTCLWNIKHGSHIEHLRVCQPDIICPDVAETGRLALCNWFMNKSISVWLIVMATNNTRQWVCCNSSREVRFNGEIWGLKLKKFLKSPDQFLWEIHLRTIGLAICHHIMLLATRHKRTHPAVTTAGESW